MTYKIKDVLLNFVLPLAISCVLAILFYKCDALKKNISDLIENIIGIIATLFGFVITALSILLTIQGNEKTKQIRESRHYKKILLTYAFASIIMLFSLIAFIIIYSFSINSRVVCFIYILCTTLCMTYLIIALWYLALIILTTFHKKKKYY